MTRCEREWIIARQRCAAWFASPDRQKGLHGATMDQCMRGQVSEECGGNAVTRKAQ